LNEKYSLEEKLLKFEKLFEDEQKYQNHLNSQHKKSTKIFFILNNELSSIRQRERQYEIDHQAYRNQIHNIKNQINKFDQQLLKQQEVIYHQDFVKQTIDRRLNRIIGEKTNEKYSESDLKIRQLKTEYENKKSQVNQLQNQIKILHEELRMIKHDFDQLTEEKNDFKNKFIQFDLYITLSEKMIKKINTEKEVKYISLFNLFMIFILLGLSSRRKSFEYRIKTIEKSFS
jgi:chromosome segregation ATPase